MIDSVKSKVMIFQSCIYPLAKLPVWNIVVGQHRIDVVEEYKYLRVEVDISIVHLHLLPTEYI